MRAMLLLAIMLLAVPAKAGGLVVFGDSISAMRTNWTVYIRDYDPAKPIWSFAKNGQTIKDLVLHSGLRANSYIDTAVYFLGTNDATARSSPYVSIWAFNAHLEFLQQRGFRVIVILPPDHPVGLPYISQIRAAMTKVSQRAGVEYHTLASWDFNLTFDGIHPQPQLSQMIAAEIWGLL
jgi:hypothetical protein